MSAVAAASWPNPWRDVVPTCWASTSPSAPLKVAQLHAIEAGVANLDYRSVAAKHWPQNNPANLTWSPAWKCSNVPDPASVVKACTDMAKPGGWVFSPPSTATPRPICSPSWGGVPAQNAAKGTHEFARFIQPAELARWCREAGLDLGQFKGMEYNPITRRYWLSGDTSVNYLLAAASH